MRPTIYIISSWFLPFILRYISHSSCFPFTRNYHPFPVPKKLSISHFPDSLIL